MNRRLKGKSGGFTLLEVVVAIVIIALALAAVVPLLSQVFMRSYEQPVQLRDAVDLHSAMEDLVASQGTNTLATLHAATGAEGSLLNGRFTVVHNRYVTFTGGAEGGSPAFNTLLKITLRNALGEQLTRLFAEEP